jgi:hypothetical protein
MARRTRDQNRAIKQKVEQLRAEGMPTEQAQAVAFRMFRDGELFIPKTQQKDKALRKKQAEALARRAALLLQLFNLVKK